MRLRGCPLLQRVLSIVVVMAGLAGCAKLHVEPMPANYQFTPKDEWGLVVMGLTAAKQPQVEANFFSVYWQRYDVAKQVVIPAPAKDVPLVFNMARGFRHDGTDIDVSMRHGVQRVPPGDYLASQIMLQKFVNGKNTQELTRTYGNQEKPVAANFLASEEQLSVAGKDVPRFTVKPGEIVYIGDYTVDVTVFPARILKIENNLARAREELAKRPTLQGEMRYGLRLRD